LTPGCHLIKIKRLAVITRRHLV